MILSGVNEIYFNVSIFDLVSRQTYRLNDIDWDIHSKCEDFSMKIYGPRYHRCFFRVPSFSKDLVTPVWLMSTSTGIVYKYRPAFGRIQAILEQSTMSGSGVIRGGHGFLLS